MGNNKDNENEKGIKATTETPREEPELDNCIVIKFNGPHSTKFKPYIRGLDPWQIMCAADTLMEVARREMREWYDSQRPEGAVLVAKGPLPKH